MHLATIDSDLVVVAAVHWGSVDITSGQRLEAVVVSPLLERHVFTSELDNFLGDKSSKECGHGGDAARAIRGYVLHNSFVNLFEERSSCFLVLRVEHIYVS